MRRGEPRQLCSAGCSGPEVQQITQWHEEKFSLVECQAGHFGGRKNKIGSSCCVCYAGERHSASYGFNSNSVTGFFVRKKKMTEEDPAKPTPLHPLSTGP